MGLICYKLVASTAFLTMGISNDKDPVYEPSLQEDQPSRLHMAAVGSSHSCARDSVERRFRGPDPWVAFIEKVEKSAPPIRALGITDYCGIDCYVEALARQRVGGFKGVGLIFPNVEFRMSIETTKGPGVNLHLLFSPDDEDHVEHNGNPQPVVRLLIGNDFHWHPR